MPSVDGHGASVMVEHGARRHKQKTSHPDQNLPATHERSFRPRLRRPDMKPVSENIAIDSAGWAIGLYVVWSGCRIEKPAGPGRNFRLLPTQKQGGFPKPVMSAKHQDYVIDSPVLGVLAGARLQVARNNCAAKSSEEDAVCTGTSVWPSPATQRGMSTRPTCAQPGQRPAQQQPSA